MGQAISYGLTQYDVDEVLTSCDGVFTQAEVESLYNRFRALDRGRKGYISAEEFLGIPELSINPLANRLVRLFESVNFRDFVRLLAAFSSRASKDTKIALMFQVYDVDGDNIVSREDMAIMIRQLAGSSLSDDDISALVAQAMQEAGAGSGEGLTLAKFKQALAEQDLTAMEVQVPVEL